MIIVGSMVLLMHGDYGGVDEIAIAVAAFVVLWVAVKLAGRKPSENDEDEQTAESEPQPTDAPAEPRVPH